MIEHKRITCRRGNLSPADYLVASQTDERLRLERAARTEPRAVLGVIEYWLATAGQEGLARVDR